jgi:hypothetical protein
VGENFTFCGFDAFVGNTFLDVYEVHILCGKNKVRICVKLDSKMVELNTNDQTTLVNIKIDLMVLSKLEPN